MKRNLKYCDCKRPSAVTTENDEWGYWEICCDCGKRIEGSYHYYNHYDGIDHDNSDIY